MSNTTPTKLRALLDDRPSGEQYKEAAKYLLEVSPNCECEGAEAVDGGHGAVEPTETLTMYLGSPRHSRKRSIDPKVMKERNGFPYNAAIFDAFCAGGLSLIREEKATDAEVVQQVRKIASGLRKDDAKNGIFAILQFKADAIFRSLDSEKESRHFCLYDTPIPKNGEEQVVLAHADLFVAGPKDGNPKVLRTQRRVQITAAIKSVFRELRVDKYRDYQLREWEADPSLIDPISSS